MVNIHSLQDYRNDKPKRLMRYILVWCQTGKLTVNIDDKKLKITKNQVVTITSGQIHEFINHEASTGYILEFTLEFFCKDDMDIELIFLNGLFCHFDENEVIQISKESLIERLLDQINEELNNKPFQYQIIVHSLIKQVLVQINRSKISLGHKIWKPSALFLKFLELVRNSFDTRQTVENYANQLNTTEQKLNELAKLYTGKTAQMVIHGLIASEAKRLLIYDNTSIKEIAFKLGFNDPFYFSNFFKKHTAISPKVYRERIK